MRQLRQTAEKGQLVQPSVQSRLGDGRRFCVECATLFARRFLKYLLIAFSPSCRLLRDGGIHRPCRGFRV